MGIVKSRKRELFDNQKKSIDYTLDVVNSSSFKSYISRIILYGSCARKEQSWNSDVDICVILNDCNQEVIKFNEFIHGLKNEFMKSKYADIDAKFVFESNFTNENSLFYKNIKKDGIVIWPLQHT